MNGLARHPTSMGRCVCHKGSFPSGLDLAKGQTGGEDLGLVGAETMFQRD